MINCKFLQNIQCFNCSPKILDIENEIKKNIKSLNKLNFSEKKIYNEQTFQHFTDEELFNNHEYIDFISTKLEFCLDNNCNNSRCKNFIIIYTSPKVGSTALWSSLNLYLSDKFKIYHFHNNLQLEFFDIYYISINQLIKIFKKYNKNVFIIDIYRPLFDILVSSFFNDLPFHFSKDFVNYNFKEPKNILERFFCLYDNSLDYFNIDYFREIYGNKCPIKNFNFDNKFLYLEDGSLKFVKLRLCDFLEWDKILYQLLGYKIKIIRYNQTINKSIGKYYDYFNNNFKISKIDFENLKNDPNLNFYYSDKEKENYLNKFKNKICDTYIIDKYPIEFIDFYYFMIKENKCVSLLGDTVHESNKTLVLNCICNNCKIKRKKIINYLYLKDKFIYNNL